VNDIQIGPVRHVRSAFPKAVRETWIPPEEARFGNQALHLVLKAADVPAVRQAVVDLDGEGQDHLRPLGEEFAQGEDRDAGVLGAEGMGDRGEAEPGDAGDEDHALGWRKPRSGNISAIRKRRSAGRKSST